MVDNTSIEYLDNFFPDTPKALPTKPFKSENLAEEMRKLATTANEVTTQKFRGEYLCRDVVEFIRQVAERGNFKCFVVFSESFSIADVWPLVTAMLQKYGFIVKEDKNHSMSLNPNKKVYQISWL